MCVHAWEISKIISNIRLDTTKTHHADSASHNSNSNHIHPVKVIAFMYASIYTTTTKTSFNNKTKTTIRKTIQKYTTNWNQHEECACV